MTFLVNSQTVQCFCRYGNVNVEYSATFCVWYVLTKCWSSTICINCKNACLFYLSLKICIENDAFKQIQDSVTVVLPW